jgi:protein tyrosine phosphatase (PTP) superfamily phosphohydrolase (DUF442 family)
VSERLHRGAQPRAGGLRRLAELGFDTVINLRGESERTRSEAAEAASLGLRYFNVPLPGWGRPDDDRVLRVLGIINSPMSGRVFIHCKDGVDRTGTIVALYRITFEGWSAEAATAEADGRGMRRVQFWMRDYIGDYYKRRTLEASAGAGSPRDDCCRDVGDRLGTYVGDGERVAVEARKIARRALGPVGGFIVKAF